MHVVLLAVVYYVVKVLCLRILQDPKPFRPA